MVKKLRTKFVVVTMLFMITVFGIIFTANSLYNRYLIRLDTLHTLEWIADCPTLVEQLGAKETDQYFESSPIYYVLLDDNGNIEYQVDSEGDTSVKMPAKFLQSIKNSSDNEWAWKSYIYISRKADNGNLEIYYTDSSEHLQRIPQIIGGIVLFLMGVILLFGVSMHLSKYVVEPAESAIKREKQFIADASHELKTPIAAISINAQAMKEDNDENQHLKNIISEADRMDRLVRKLLTLSYIEAQGSQFDKCHFSLSEACEEIVLTLESIAFEKKIKYEYQIKENIEYFGNEDEIKQVIVILLDNAVKHTPELGKIAFQLEIDKCRPLIQVYNTGSGIAEEDIPHIFERFYNTEKSRSDMDSFGLGLAIAKSIIEAHSGTIKASSQYGVSTSFRVEL